MIDLSGIKGPVVLHQTESTGYRDPAAFYRDGVFYLYFTMVEQEAEEQYFTIGMVKSRDLVHWSDPVSLTERSKEKEYSGPGNLFEFKGKYYLCMQTYCRENGERYGNERSRIFTMETDDFEHFKEPVLLRVKGDGVPEEKMGRMIDPYLIKDKDDPDKVWCFYKQNGVSYSYSYDMEHWTYAGHADCGENVCAIVKDNTYYLMHSPENGIGLLKSKDLVHFEEEGPVNFLSQSRWVWAKDRITAGCLLDLTEVSEVGGYLMFYHGDNEKNGTFLFGASIAMAFTKDLENYVTFEYEEPTYPNLGNIYEGDYYRELPFAEYIDQNQPQPGEGEPVFDIRDFGAAAVPGRVNTAAFTAAAEACRRAGGGTILVQGGRYVTGTFRLYSHTTLHIASGAAVEASRESSRLQTALLLSDGAEDVTITGGGTIHGNGEWYVYEPKLKPRLTPIPVSHLPRRGTDNRMLPATTLRYHYRRRIRFSEDKYQECVGPTARPPFMICFRNCRRVKIENIVLEDAMTWTLNLFACQGAVVRNTVINNNRHVANTDGIDITGSSRVEIDHCFVSTADDGIVIKNSADTKTAMSDIHIHDCQVITVMNSFKIGTETGLDISRVLVENCRFFMPDIYPGTTSGIAIESADGSHISDVTVRNITMDKVTCPVFICLNMRNRYGVPASADRSSRYWGGSIKGVTIEHVSATDVEVPSLIFGFRTVTESGEEVRKPVEDITIRDFKAVYKDNEEIVEVPEEIEEYLYDYPENNSFGDVDAYGFWIRHGDNVTLEDITVIPRSVNTRERIKLYDVR